MAYCPMAQGGDLQRQLLNNKILLSIAHTYNISVVDLLLKFVLEQENIIAIPRSGNKEHIKQNWYIKDLKIDKEDLILINKEFPSPKIKTYLDIV